MTNKDLIKQYTNTGAILPQYQVEKLNSGLQKTYIRRRMAQATQDVEYAFRDYEFNMIPEEEKNKYLMGMATSGKAQENELRVMDDEMLKVYIDRLVSRSKLYEKMGYPKNYGLETALIFSFIMGEKKYIPTSELLSLSDDGLAFYITFRLVLYQDHELDNLLPKLSEELRGVYNHAMDKRGEWYASI